MFQGWGTEFGIINSFILATLTFLAQWFYRRHQHIIRQHTELWEDYQYQKRKEQSAQRHNLTQPKSVYNRLND